MHIRVRHQKRIVLLTFFGLICYFAIVEINQWQTDERWVDYVNSLPSMDYDEAYFTALDTRMRRSDRVVYNRVPKCASSATIRIINTLSDLSQRFSLYRSPIYHREHIDKEHLYRLTKRLKKLHKPLIFERHMHFVNFEEFGMDMPMYINIVRKPIDRFISEYYFYRFDHPREMSEWTRFRTFDECVLQQYKECSTESAFVVIPFFCGQQPQCLKPSPTALQLAKRNLDRYFGPVGIMEDLPSTYALFEKTITQFFSNMTRIAEDTLSTLRETFQSHHKLQPSQTAFSAMQDRLSLENEFYYYVRQRYFNFLKHYEISSPLLKSLNNSFLNG